MDSRNTMTTQAASVSLLLFALLLPTETRADPLDGRLRGFDEPVRSFGTFSQSVPLEVPPFRGIEPRLSLDYVSGGTRGILGLGWSLSGFSAVTQRPAESSFGWEEYMLDDADLVSCDSVATSPGCEGAQPGTYTTKIESRLRIERSFDYYPSYNNWVVSYPDGKRALYDRVAGYKRWQISTVYDTLGNRVSYEWACPPGDAEGRCYPDQIRYNPHHPVVIRFFYEDRPDPVAYRSPGLVDLSVKEIQRRLHSILVQVDGTNLRAYELEYRLSPATGSSLVSKVREYGRDVLLDSSGRVTSGTPFPFSSSYSYADTMPSTAFGAEASYSVPSVFQYQAIDGWDTGLRVIDLNGDGLQDLLQVTPDVSHAWINDNGGWLQDDAYAANLPPFTRNPNSGDCYAASLGDFNGDGLTDVAKSCPLAHVIYFYMNNRAGFEYDPDYDFTYTVWDGGLGAGDLFLDLNGDLRTDILRLPLGKGYLNGGALGWSGGMVQFASGLPANHFEGVRVGDLNGDGLPDILQGTRAQDGGDVLTFQGAWLSTGYGFASSPSFVPPANFYYIYTKTGDTGLRLADLNGDGKADLIQSHRGIYGGTDWVTTQRAWISTGTGWESADSYASNVGFFSYDGCPAGDTGRRLFDINGDGAVDVVKSYRGSINGLPWDTYQSVQDGQMVFRDLMTVARSRLGGSANIAYEPSTRWLQSSLPMVAPTVAAMTLEDGRGTVSDYLYEYAGAAFDGVEQQFTGFAEVREMLPAHSPGSAGSRFTRYLNDIAAMGMPVEDLAYDETGACVWRALLTYDVANQVPYKAQLVSRRDVTFAGQDTAETMSNYEYDSYGNLTARLDFGDVWTSGDELRAEFVYNPNQEAYIIGRVAETSVYDGMYATDNLLQQTLFYYDGATTTEEPPAHGLLTEVQSWLGAGQGYASTRTEYSTKGDVIATYDALNNKTEYLRDDGFWVNEVRDALYGEDPRHHMTVTDWDVACGLPACVEDGNGLETTSVYDDFCRLEATLFPGGGFETRTYGQDSGGLLYVRTERPSADGVSNWFEETHYDGFGRSWRTDSSGPNGDTIRTETTYNPRGMKVRQDTPFYVSDGNAEAYVTSQYDVLGRPTERRSADGAATTWAYGLLDTVITDPTGRQRKIIRDIRGRETEFLELNDGNWEGVASELDVLGRRVSMTDQAGNVINWAYDAAGRVLWEEDPDRGYTTLTYDAAGRMEHRLDGDGSSTCFAYDALGRKVEETTGCGTAEAETVTWVFDEARPGYYNVGRLTSQGGAINESFNYDAAGNLARRTRTIAGHPYSFDYGYDADGRRTSTAFPDGTSMTRSYDGAGRPESISGVSADLQYGADGQLESWSNANGSEVTYEHSPERRWLSHISATHGGATILDLGYSYHANGLLASVAGPFEHDSWAYEYDGAGKLTLAQSVLQSSAYQYNNIGNTTYSTEAGSYTYGPAGQPRPHAPTSIDHRRQSYDEVGQREHRDGHFLNWDHSGRLETVGLIVFSADGMPIPAHYTDIGYDANGSRFKKVHNGVVTLYLGDGVEVTGGVYTKWVRAGDQLLANVVGGDVNWLYTDHLGSVRAVEDAAGQLICREAYLAYGEPLNGCTTGGASYTGQQMDETGLLFLNARYYDPSVGQFISPDSVISTMWPIGMNRYAYANGNPLLYIDPSGHWSMTNTLGVLQAAAGAFEIVGGIVTGVAVGWTGVGGFCAGGMIVLGIDTMVAGIRTAATGTPAVPFTQQGFTEIGSGLGMPKQDAAKFGFGMFVAANVAFGAGAGVYAGAAGGAGGAASLTSAAGGGGLAIGISVSAEGASAASLGAGVGLLSAAAAAGVASTGGDGFRFNEYQTPEQAIGQLDGKARLVGTDKIKNPVLRQQGYTERRYYIDDNGTKWSVNVRYANGRAYYQVGHQSSYQP